MKKTPFILDEARSENDHEALVEAYLSLEEKDKVQILKNLKKHAPAMLQRIIRKAKFLGGVSQQRVITRFGRNGRIIDNWLKASEQREFFARILYGWLVNLPDELESIYSLFENATLEKECIKLVEIYLNENQNDAIAVVRGRLALAWLNFDNILASNKSKKETNNKDIDKETKELNAQILLDELEKKSSELIELAGEVAGGLSWNEERWQISLKSAKETVGKIRSEVEKRAELLGEESPVWSDRQGLESVLKHLEREIEKQKGNEMTSKFLRDLANEIKQLVPIQRLAQKRQKHALLRDAASKELELAAEAAPPNWKAEGPLEKGKWLDWASKISGQELEKLLSVLNDTGFPKTAELLEDLEVFDRNANLNAENDSKTTRLADFGQDQATQPPLEGGSSTPKEPPVESNEVLKQLDDSSVALEAIDSKSLPSFSGVLETKNELAITKKPEECEAVAEKLHAENQKTLEQRKAFSSVEEAAAAVTRASDADIEACVEGLIWQLLKCGERMIAWQTLKCAVEEKGMTRAFPVSPQILEILALMPVYAEGTTEVFERVRACLPTQPDKIFVENQRPENIVRRLFLSAACFLPALLDKISNASTSLTEISLGKAGSIRHLQKVTLEFASGTVEINQSILDAALNQQGWQEQLDDLKAKLEEFRSQVVHRKINYAPARQIWVQWFNPGALFDRVFSHALKIDRNRVNDLSLEVNSIDIEHELEKAWKEYRGKGELIGTARDQLRRYAEDAKKLVRGITDHCEMHGQFENDYRRKLVRQIVDSFQKHLPKALGDLQEYTKKEFGEDDRGKISFELLTAELERAGAFLSGKKNELVCDDLEIWEGSDFARIDSSNMETRLIPSGPVASRNSWSFDALIQGLSNPLLEWEEALSISLRNDDHQTARRILDRMFLENIDTECLEKEKKESFDLAIAQVKRALGITEDKLGEALNKGWITAQVHQNLSDEVQNYSILLQSEEIKDYPFNQWLQKLEKIAIQIRSHHTDEVSKIRERIDLLKAGSKEEHETIITVLTGGDVNLATDYLTQIEEEGALHPRSDQSRGSRFTEFFAPTNGDAPLAEKIHEMLVVKNINSSELVKRVAEGEEIFGRILEEGHRSETSDALQTWMQISRSRNFDPSSVLKLIKAFGFPAKGIHQERGKPLVINLEKTVFCPVPDFGSVLGDQLITLCDVSSTSAETAIDRVSSISNFASKPVLLLWFKAVDSSTRRTFARICHEKAHKILLVDSVLALHVLLNTDSRLRTLFDCALPFTSITPYSTTGGALAEEMFVGRRHEIRAIESDAPSGACFVYGGRQIGKSVLLRKVAKDFDDKTGKRIALYIDLTRHTVGTRETMEDVWRIMADELGKRDSSIFKGSNPYKVTPKSFIANVVAWLNHDSARRILLLLDESDALLTADGENEIGNQHFDICNKIRGLMAETERRFKVVFAGLHNVQRTTMVANNPLAQLGRPICIGPLMQNGEAREAFRLIEQPFVAAGVTFENHHVINGILARTNYYPNLIQIVCSSLLSKVVDRQLRSDPKGTPPYRVNSRDVEDAFNNPELRAELRKKFLLTLDLDKRYQLIAYIVAFNRKEKEEGMTADEIHSNAKFYWEQGFSLEPRASADVENEMFNVLLEEMCGLGILRQPRSGIFCLRSPNVAELLGTDAELERVLETAHLWEVTEPYAPETFRSVIGHKFPWRSPLTSKQETILEQSEPPVLVIAGCKASGIEDLENRVKEKFRGGYFRHLQQGDSTDVFTKSVQELSKCKEGGKTILYVPASCDWNFEWVEKALQRVTKLTSNGRAVGVVFVADADRVWQLGGDWRKVASRVGAGYFQLRQWSRSVLKAFLKDGGNILNTAENVNAIAKATGLWAGALNVFHETLATGSWQDTWLTDGTLLNMIRCANSIENLFGIKPDDRRLVLQELADAGDCDQVLLSQYLLGTRQITSEVVAKVMEWAAVLSLVSLRDEKLCLDPFVKSMIQFSKNDFEKQA